MFPAVVRGWCRHALPDTRDQAQPKCNHETERRCQWLGSAGQGWEPEVLTVGGNSVMVDTAIMLGASGYLGRHLPLPRALDTGDRSFLFRWRAGGRGRVSWVMGDGCQYPGTACSYPWPTELMQMPDVSPVSVLSWSSVASCFTELE